MASHVTLHERISAHPGMAHSTWVANHPMASLRDIELMRKRFERIGQHILDDVNRNRCRTCLESCYAIPGEPEYVGQQQY